MFSFMFLRRNFNFGYHYPILFCKNVIFKHPKTTFVYGVGNEILDDTWALDTRGPFSWDRLNPSGNQPSGRMLVI